jgi:hypothetical protein
MALAFVGEVQTVARALRMVVATVTFDASYPTGGETFTPADLGLQRIDWLSATTDGSFAVVWDKAAGKLKAYTNAGVEVTNATSLATLNVRLLAVGI